MKRTNPLTLTAGLLLAAAALSCDHPTEPTEDIVSPVFTTIGSGVDYEMTVLESAGPVDYASDINDQGQVVGRRFTAEHPNGPWDAFLWEDGLWTALLPGQHSQAWGVNDQGQVVGARGFNAALWEETAPGEGWTLSDLGTLDGNALTEARDINDHGEVVGLALEVLGQAYTQSPFYWADGVFTALEMPGGWALATAINNEGQIVGYGATAEGPGSAFLWEDAWSTPISLTGLGQAWDINDDGQVAGIYGSRAAIWKAGNHTILGWLGPEEHSQALGINNLGEVVGSSPISGVPHAFHWKDGVMTDLGVLPGHRSVAVAINDQGQVVGNGSTPSGTDPYALLWSVADPGSTQPGQSVEVTPNDATTGEPAPTTITFEEVTGSGETTVESSTVGVPGSPPSPSTSNFRLGQPPTFFDIQTTATFTGSVVICIDYAEVSFGNESKLKLLHFNESSGTWEDVTTSLDTVNDIICGETTSLSPFLVAETNVAPAVHSISLPGDPVPVGTTVTATATFTDDNPTDAHTAVLDWGEGEGPGTVSGSGGSGTVSGSFTYTAPGVYTVQVTVSDGDLSGSRSSALDEPAFVVVYDPDGGFVTGGGWIMSPEGAYAPDPSLTGKASFGFVSKYKKGASVPTGNTEFKLQAGDLNFHSSQYQWLVVNQGGRNAQFKGSGTINGAGIYKFMLWAGDGDPDTFRIKIWEEDELGNETDVYDNGFDQAIGGGNIVIHTK